MDRLKIELKESIPFIVADLNEFHKKFIHFIRTKKGKIQSNSDVIKAQFGNMFLTRFLGVWLSNMLLKNHLPFFLEAKIIMEKDRNRIDFHLYDNMGPLIAYIDNWTISIYQSAYKKIIQEIKEFTSKQAL